MTSWPQHCNQSLKAAQAWKPLFAMEELLL